MSSNNTIGISGFLKGNEESNETEDLIEQLGRGANITEADPTRSTLHTGSYEDGEGTLGHAPETSPRTSLDVSPVTVEDINEGPSGVSLDSTSVAENAAGAVVGTLSVLDVDANDSHTFEVSDDRFEVVDGQLRLRPGESLDHEDAAQLTIDVTATDSGGATLRESFDVTVEDINEGPSGVSLDSTSVAENAAGAVVGTLSVLDVDANDSHTFEVSDDRFEVVDGQLRLRPGESLDHEDAAQLTIDVTATDSGGATLRESFDVTVEDINEGPSGVSLDSTSVAENAAGAVVGTLSVLDVDANDSHTFEVSDDRFEVVDGQLRLRPGESLDHEDAAQLTIDVTATDSGGATLRESFDVTVEDINEGPSGVSLDSTSVAENAAGAVVGTLSVLDVDANDSHTFEVSDDRFEVVDGQLRLRPGESLDHEDAAQLTIDVTATDSGGATLRESFDVTVEDINEGPSGVSLDSTSVAENAAGAVVGTLSVLDVDANDSHTFEVSDDRFEVVDGQLRLRPGESLDHEDAAQLTIDVTATDSGGATLRESFDVTVEDINEGPSGVSLDSTSVAENAAGAVVGTLSVLDVDANDSHTFEVSDDRFEVVDGQLRLRPGESLDHEDAAQLTIDVTATDSGGATLRESFDVTVEDINEGPSGVSLDSTSVAENAAGAVVGTLSVLDVDANDSHTFEVSDDRFEVVDGQLRLRPGESLDHEDAAQLTIDVTATDSGGATLRESFDVTVEDINEGPSGVSLDSTSVAENAAGAVVGTLSVLDVDANDSHTFEVSDDRFEVVDGQLRLRPGESLDHEDAAQLTIDVTATDSGGATLRESFDVTVVEMPDVEVTSGFHAQYFDVDHRLENIEDVDWSLDPTHADVTSEINYENGRGSFWEGGSTDTFGVQINGNIEVPENGTFEFHLGGDDGAVLFVDGNPVIDNDGLHGFRTRSGEIELEAGTHHIEVRYFENYGHAGLQLEWAGPGIDGVRTVSAPDVSDAQTVSGIPLVLDISVDQDAMPEGGLMLLQGLPQDAVVQAGSEVVNVGSDGSVDISGWQTDLLTVTPPLDYVGTVEAALVLKIPTPDSDFVETCQPLTFQVNEAHIQSPQAEMVGGFQASYFDVNQKLNRLDDIDWDVPPTHQEIVGDINYENSSGSFWEGGARDTFGAKLEGEVTIEEGGLYNFFVGADDGVVLLINGEAVIDNDGLHGFQTRSGEIELEPGTYDIEVRYFENYGHAGLRLEWEGPDTSGRELVRADADTNVEENGTLQVGIDVTATSDSATVELVGLPADTIIISGDQSAVSQGDPIDVSAWNLDSIEISPPPGYEGVIEGEIQISDTGFNGAGVTSSSSFEIAVGDVEVANTGGDGLAEELSERTGEGTGSNQDSWAMESATEDDLPEQDEVMSEVTVVPIGGEITDLNFESYERVDW